MDDKPKDWVDFAAAKAVRFEVALEALGLMGSLRRDGEQLQGICPLHKASGDKESFGVHTGKQTFNCFACKKHGKVLDFVMQVKQIGAKDAAVWLLSLVDKEEVQERVPAETAAGDGGRVVGSGAAVMQEAAHVEATSLPAIEGLTAREAWLAAVIAQGVAWYLAETFKPLSDTGTIEKCIVAKVAMAAGIGQVREGGNDV